MKRSCFNCGETDPKSISVLFSYTICNSCKSKLGLFQDKTIKRHFLSYEKLKEEDPSHRSYDEEMSYRLDFIEKDYIKKRIKLLYIRERLGELGEG